MKKLRLLSACVPICLLFMMAGCFAPKQSTFTKEQMEEREREARNKHKKSRFPEKARRISGLDEDEENEKYDGVLAAQQREFMMTHDPATNTIPKDRLFNVLARRNDIIRQQNEHIGAVTTQGAGAGIIGTDGTPLFPVNRIDWMERGSYADAVGPSNGNGRDSNGVTSGRITALWNDMDPTKPNQVFVGGIDGGLWSCPDITQSAPNWYFIDNFSNLAISSICQDPTNPNVMYFGTGEKSINADAVLGGGIWKSTNHGATWFILNNTTTFTNVSKILCDNNGFVYVGTNYKPTTIGASSRGVGFNVGMMRSKDGGSSWDNITPKVSGLVTPRISDMVYDPTNDKMDVYVGYYPSDSTILTGFCYGTPSTITPTTWSTPTSLATGLGMFITTNPTGSFLFQTVLAVKNGVVWALRSNYNFTTSADAMPLYRSLDGGATWTLQSTQTDGDGQGWYSIALDCDPQNPANNVIFASLDVLKSTNGGVNFTETAEWVTSTNGPKQYVHADGHNVYYNTNAAGLNRVIVCSDGGIFYSANGGINWADRNIGLRLKQFYSCAINPSVPDYYLAGAQDNGSHQFTQPGLGTSTEITGGDGCIVGIDQLNPKNQVASYVYNAYYISTDGGQSWASKTFGSSTGQFVNPFEIDSKTKKLYAAYTAGTYLRWDDPFTTRNTSTAVPISSLFGSTTIVTAVTVSPNLANTIYLGDNSMVAKVTNANTNTPTITSITPPGITPGSAISSVILGPSTTDQDIIVTSSSFGAKKVFISADGGSTWAEITGNLPDLPVRWALFYPGSTTQLLVATDAGIWENTNGVSSGTGTSWVPSQGFPAVRSDMIRYSPTNGVIAVGTHGRGLWTAKVSSNPKISYYNTLLTASKNAGSEMVGCRIYQDYPDTLIISESPTGTATATLSTVAGGTAVEGVDFDFTTNGSFTAPSHVVTFNNATYPNRLPIMVRVYNNHDKNATLPQTASIGFTVSGNTDAVAAATNQVVNLTLNDVIPTKAPLTAQPIWIENWESAADGYANWTFSPDAYHNSLPNTTAFVPYYSNCSSNITTITAQLVTTDASGNISLCANGNGGTAFTARMYRAVNAANNRYSAMTVAFSYRSGGNAAMTNSLVYSTNNGISWTILASYAARTTTATVTVSLPAALNNTNFLLGWQTVSTAASVYNTYGFGVDDITVSGTIAPSPIDSTASSTSTDYVSTGQNIDFYSANNNIIANISNASQSLACTNVTIENAGNTWQSFSHGNRSQKTFFITPSQNNTTATYNATFYFTNAELSGMNPATLRIAKTTASSIAAADNTNTILVTPSTDSTYSVNGVAIGYGFTGSFTGFSRFFLVDANVALPITLLDFKATLVDGSSQLVWVTSNEQNNHQFDVEVSMDGIIFVKLGTVLSKGNSTTDVTYNYTHVKPAAGTYYYRLKQIDNDGRFTYSKTIALTIANGSIANAFLYPVPASKLVTLNFGTIVQQATINMYSNDMKLLRTESVGQATVTKDVDISTLPAGVYFLRITTANKTETLRFVKE